MVIVPYVALPPAIVLTLQFTCVSVVPVTVAVNCCCSLVYTDADGGCTETVTEARFTVALACCRQSASEVAVIVMMEEFGRFAGAV